MFIRHKKLTKFGLIILDLFKKFLEKKLFQGYNIKKIDLCYKLNEIISLQKNIEELDEKIERMEFDQSIIEKNEKMGK